MAAGARSNDHIHLYETERRGYLRLELRPGGVEADFRMVETTQQPQSSIETTARWVVESGRPGARPA
jgi:alkaline phosphatase D